METSRRKKEQAAPPSICEVCSEDALPGRRTCGKRSCAGALGAEARDYPPAPPWKGQHAQKGREPRRYDGEGRVIRKPVSR